MADDICAHNDPKYTLPARVHHTTVQFAAVLANLGTNTCIIGPMCGRKWYVEPPEKFAAGQQYSSQHRYAMHQRQYSCHHEILRGFQHALKKVQGHSQKVVDAWHFTIAAEDPVGIMNINSVKTTQIMVKFTTSCHSGYLYR